MVERLFSARLTSHLVSQAAEDAVDLADLPRLAAVDPGSLSHGGRVELIEAFERVKAVIDGLQQTALAAVVEATEAVGLDGDLARHEVGAALRLSPVTAHRRTRVAADLVRRLPATLGELTAGRIGYLQAAHLAEAVADLPDEVASAVQARVLARAPGQTVAETRRATARAVHAADPAGAAERHRRAVAGRRIERTPLPEAMAGWWVAMPAHHEAAAFDALTATARATQQALRGGAGDDPGLDALRVDALLDAIHDRRMPAEDAAQTLTQTAPGAQRGATLRCPGGCRGAAAAARRPPPWWSTCPPCSAWPSTPASCPATAPSPPRWPASSPPTATGSAGSSTPPPAACSTAAPAATAAPGGYAPSSPPPTPAAGSPAAPNPPTAATATTAPPTATAASTIVINLGPLCRQHHNAKTHGHWRVTHDPDTGALTWTSPLGKTYTKSIDPILE